MENYKITLQYDGSKYNGWQKQGNTDNTIQGKIEAVLLEMAGKQIEVQGSGRTDAGTHAYGQVANFHINTNMKTTEIIEYLNRYLPTDIAVISIQQVPERFHSRLNAKSKKYIYRIHNSTIPNVFERKYTYFCPRHLDIEAMKSAVEFIMGEHDFTSFCANRSLKKSAVRTIYSIDIKRVNGEISILFNGNGFLYNMVRIITGTLIEIGEGKRKPEDMKSILESKNREAAGFTAPSQGLVLAEVEY